MKTYVKAYLSLLVMVLTGLQGATQNLLQDGSFSTRNTITPFYTNPAPQGVWCSWVEGATVSMLNTQVNGGVCSFSFYNSSNKTWDVQLIQFGFNLEAGYRYQLTFDVKADAPRSFGVYVGENGGNWTNLNSANYLQNCGASWQTKSMDIDVYQTYSAFKLSVEMGAENIPMHFDNFVLVKTGPLTFPTVDIIGSAVPPYNWSTGVNMETLDGVHYVLKNYTLIQGELKFRQNQDWIINWGATNFPSGVGYQNGPNIPVLPGTYNISFNRLSGAYFFECVDCVPYIGILGSAVPPYDWNTDMGMTSTDGILYQLDNVQLSWGELRFRQDHDWNINWGGTTFPSGTGSLYAPNIQVPAGIYDITFNRLTAAYTFIPQIPSIGILGSALNGWDTDIDMQTTDGENYTLKGQDFSTGEVKFREDNSWNINWGNTDFPWGYGYRGGPNIPVPAGKYNVYFNRTRGNYYFEIVCPDPVLICPDNITVPMDTNSCGAIVTYTYPYPESSCGNFYIYQSAGLPSGVMYPKGITTNTFVLYQLNTGKSDTRSFTVTVMDETAPVIANVSTSVTSLWPPDHSMKEVIVNYDLSDNCFVLDSMITVSSNEPENGLGDGDTSPDWKVINNHLVQLRSERSGTGKGRTYTITITALDESGNMATAVSIVMVPHNANGKKTPDYVGEKNNGSFTATITPNPSAQYFNLNISGNSTAPIVIKVIDVSGRIVSTMQATQHQSIRFGQNLQPGMYVVEIVRGSQKTLRKIVKQ